MQTQTHTTARKAKQQPDNEARDLLAATVDRLAMIKAEINRLQNEEAALRADLIDSGADLIEGTYHRAAITYNTTRSATAWEALARACIDPELLPDLIEDYTTTGQPFDTVRIGAKKTS